MNMLQATSQLAGSNKALNPPSQYCFVDESSKHSSKFSREFQRKVPVNSNFTACKLSKSRENFRHPFMFPVNQQVTICGFSGSFVLFL